MRVVLTTSRFKLQNSGFLLAAFEAAVVNCLFPDSCIVCAIALN